WGRGGRALLPPPPPDHRPGDEPRRRERDCDGGEQKTPSAASVGLRPCWSLASAQDIVELVGLDQVAVGFRHALPFAGAGAPQSARSRPLEESSRAFDVPR